MTRILAAFLLLTLAWMPVLAEDVEDAAAAVEDRSRREPWMRASERTQALLDAVLKVA